MPVETAKTGNEAEQRANFLAFNWGNLWRVRTKQAKAWRKKQADGTVTEAKEGASEIQMEIKRIQGLILKISNMDDAALAKKEGTDWDEMNQELMDARLSCWKIIDSLRGGRLRNEDGQVNQAYQIVHTDGVERRQSASIIIQDEESESLEIEHKIVEIETLLADLEERRERGIQEADPDAEAPQDEDDFMEQRKRGSIGFTDQEKLDIRSSLGMAQAKLALQTIEDDKGDLMIGKVEATDGTAMDKGEAIGDVLKTAQSAADNGQGAVGSDGV